MIPDIADLARAVSVWALPVLLAITLHEAAHGWAAWKLGDDTARRLGRVSFNPLRHVDPFGTVVLPAMILLLSGGRFMLGYAKPVPVAVERLRNPRWHMVLVAAAGPAANLLIAFVAALLLHTLPYLPSFALEWAGRNLENAILFNLVIAVFNMMPLPPLDGGRIVTGLLPYRLAVPFARLERWGLLIVLGLVFLLPFLGNRIGMDLDLFSSVILGTAYALAVLVLTVAGFAG
ncbi:Zn-dependent protease [Constrictibacter sp. MBR-5]|uniref:site-2 protease family protein n=1 Tax=Constrictibacter sp. MBR-5 TaxID=3156467 RepID=UPI0033980A97